MSENYGSAQPRVLEVKDRSWDNVVFPQGIPMASSEAMLPGMVANEKAAKSLSATTPSGWIQVGPVIQSDDYLASEASATPGTVIASASYPADTFGIAAENTSLTAIVNGWVLNVVGPHTSLQSG